MMVTTRRGRTYSSVVTALESFAAVESKFLALGNGSVLDNGTHCFLHAVLYDHKNNIESLSFHSLPYELRCNLQRLTNRQSNSLVHHYDWRSRSSYAACALEVLIQLCDLVCSPKKDDFKDLENPLPVPEVYAYTIKSIFVAAHLSEVWQIQAHKDRIQLQSDRCNTSWTVDLHRQCVLRLQGLGIWRRGIGLEKIDDGSLLSTMTDLLCQMQGFFSEQRVLDVLRQPTVKDATDRTHFREILMGSMPTQIQPEACLGCQGDVLEALLSSGGKLYLEAFWELPGAEFGNPVTPEKLWWQLRQALMWTWPAKLWPWYNIKRVGAEGHKAQQDEDRAKWRQVQQNFRKELDHRGRSLPDQHALECQLVAEGRSDALQHATQEVDAGWSIYHGQLAKISALLSRYYDEVQDQGHDEARDDENDELHQREEEVRPKEAVRVTIRTIYKYDSSCPNSGYKEDEEQHHEEHLYGIQNEQTESDVGNEEGDAESDGETNTDTTVTLPEAAPEATPVDTIHDFDLDNPGSTEGLLRRLRLTRDRCALLATAVLKSRDLEDEDDDVILAQLPSKSLSSHAVARLLSSAAFTSRRYDGPAAVGDDEAELREARNPEGLMWKIREAEDDCASFGIALLKSRDLEEEGYDTILARLPSKSVPRFAVEWLLRNDVFERRRQKLCMRTIADEEENDDRPSKRIKLEEDD